MHRLLTFPAGPRAKFGVFTVVLLFSMAVGGAFAGRFEDAQKNETVSFLPGKAESVKALKQVKTFSGDELSGAVIVYRRGSGLTAADRRAVAADRVSLTRRPPVATLPPGPPIFSRDGRSALLIPQVRARGEADQFKAAVKDIRARAAAGVPPGLQVKVTGAAGFGADAIEVFGNINGTLLLATAAIVLVLLIVIYRSPIFWLVPMFTLVLAESTARGMGYLLAEAGVTINGQSGGILPVLVFGAGTDYALLLVARYREELRRREDRHDAMRVALGRAGPAIVASGLTVIAALLTLSVADVNGTAGLGPIGAMGVALAMVYMLTMLPSLLVIVGRRAFWPFIPHVGDEASDEVHGFWRNVAEGVAARPRRVWVAVILLLLLLAAPLARLDTGLTNGNSFRDSVEAVQGRNLLEKSFPPGANVPTTVVTPDPSKVPAIQAALRASGRVSAVGRPKTGPAGATFDVALRIDPYSTRAFDEVPALRRIVKRAGGTSALVGGPTAESHDYRVSAARDNRLIIPLALLLVFLILAGLLRALVAPLLLIATVILSFAAALGVGVFFFDHVFGFPGIDPSLPLLTFVFLVALGIDYNIFLMARVREETLKYGTRAGMLRGVAVTGGVITSAGIVLAGTFSALAVLPLVFLTEIGFVIAFGVLLDTFLVRSVLVPALVFDIGPRVWLPSTLAHSLDRREPRTIGATPVLESASSDQ